MLILKQQRNARWSDRKNEFLIINGKEVVIRPLVTKTKKVIVFNVSSPVPQYIIQNAFETLIIKCVSSVTTLKASINNEGYNHVLSSRRQTYIDPSYAGKLPEFVKIDYDDTSNYTYPSINTAIKCSTAHQDSTQKVYIKVNFMNFLNYEIA